jgi:carboxymethylenebutenolidase
VLSEEEFKKLHQLRSDAAPPLHGKMIDLATSRAYLSLPERASAPLPGVVVVHEWWGLNEHVKHWSDRLANDGYAALAVDLYGGTVAQNPDDAMKAMKAVHEDKARAILLDAYGFLKRDPRIRAPKRGVIGWCFGGKWSLELALAAPDLDAAVVYYGHVTTDAKELSALHAPLFAVFGNRDKGIPPSMVDAFEKALTENKARFTIKRYDAEHAFANPSNPRYDEKSAGDAWRNVRAFLARELRGKP